MASHSHSHPHGTPAHADPHSITHHNRTFFDDLAAKYDIAPWARKAAEQVTAYIQHNLPFIAIPSPPSPIKLLDYACGTGMISRALGPSVTSIHALDLSPNMIERYTALAAESTTPSVRAAHAQAGNLLADDDDKDEQQGASLDGPDWHGFDIASVGLALHHFPDAAKAVERLVQRLKVGGVLLIVDFVEDGDENWVASEADRTVHKHGFGEGEMRAMMEGKGLGGFGWSVMPETVEIRMVEEKPMYRKVFLARGVKTSG